MRDNYGRLGLALRDNHYYVSDSNYGWDPDDIGDHTDIGDWWTWFRGPGSASYVQALLADSSQNSDYSRLAIPPPSGPNRIVMFKSCFPNSNLGGSSLDPVPPIAENPLRGQDAWSEYHTVANAKGIYQDLIECFRTHTDTLFVAVTAPPLSDPGNANNARALNQWLIHDWLKDYTGGNVFVFDFYNVLTSNGGTSSSSDVGSESGNHHRWWQGREQHVVALNRNTLAYPSSSDDDHPNITGSRKATSEFIPLLNAAVNAWLEQTNPPAPHFEHIQFVDNKLNMQIANLQSGSDYALEFSMVLPGVWTEHTRWLARSSATNITVEPSANHRHGFYRVLIVR